ncbi:hypothetical protein ONZ45_g12279 [Pleurotus djamor]|nr:hypothetical protein ONZ45_g12279 [Pleurotus djamor]
MTKSPSTDGHEDIRGEGGSSMRRRQERGSNVFVSWEHPSRGHTSQMAGNGSRECGGVEADRGHWYRTTSQGFHGGVGALDSGRSSVGAVRKKKRLFSGSDDESTNPTTRHTERRGVPSTYGEFKPSEVRRKCFLNVAASNHYPTSAPKSFEPYPKPIGGGEYEDSYGKGKGRIADAEPWSPAESSTSALARLETDQVRARRPRERGKDKGKLKNEQERKDMLEADVWAENVQPHSVDCVACRRTFALDTRGRYRATNWYKHRQICGEISRLEQERGHKDDR